MTQILFLQDDKFCETLVSSVHQSVSKIYHYIIVHHYIYHYIYIVLIVVKE